MSPCSHARGTGRALSTALRAVRALADRAARSVSGRTGSSVALDLPSGGSVPFLSWQEHEKRLALCLNFMASFAIMLALSVHTLLPVTCLTACAALILALRETLVTTRARQAWESMRLRLAGVVLALLGTSLTTLIPDPAILRLGDLFLSVGLCLMAGLGLPVTTREQSGINERGTTLLDMLLCLSVVALMLRLPERETTHMVLVLAGLAGLWLCIMTRQDGPRPLVALSIIAATLPNGVLPALLLLSSGLVLAAHPAIDRSMRCWILSGLPPGRALPHVVRS